jgi:hypothetical protein
MKEYRWQRQYADALREVTPSLGLKRAEGSRRSIEPSLTPQEEDHLRVFDPQMDEGRQRTLTIAAAIWSPVISRFAKIS